MPLSTASPSYAKVGAANRCARLNGGLCTDWWQAVAPAEGPVNDNRLQRRIRITATVTAADMRPWRTTVDVDMDVDDAAIIIGLAENCPTPTYVNVTFQ